MKKLFTLTLLAALLLAGCSKKKVEVALLGDNAFADGSATLTLLLSEVSSGEVTVGLSYLNRDMGASKAIPGGALSYANPVSIAPGSTSARIKVSLDDSSLADGDYCAVFGISYASGALISRTSVATVYLKIGGGPQPIEPQLMSSWKVEQRSAPYTNADLGTDTYLDLAATVPGIKYFWVESNTDADLAQYYGGTVEGLLQHFSDNISGQVAGGTPIGNLLWSASEASAIYAIYWNPGPTYFYIMEFDATGKVTGRYGKTPIDLFNYDEYFGSLTLTDKSTEWPVTYSGVESYSFPDGPADSEYFTVAGTGSTPYSFILEKEDIIKTESDLRSYMLDDFLNYYASDVICGSAAEDIYYTAPGKQCSLYEAVKGNFTAYLIAYDPETCYPTGEYSRCDFTDVDGADPAPSGAARRHSFAKKAATPIKMLKSTR